LSEKPSGYILCYRTGASNQGTRECILKFPKITTLNEAAQLVGKKVAWPVGEHKINGKIVAIHGKRGLVRSRFRKGVPGKALLTPIDVIR
jgi:ribosomal protein L35AE/L33A